ncbi:MAG: response regulator [Bryobacterales bacterium]|nr:response regulator [Bryobacterales bacterium]
MKRILVIEDNEPDLMMLQFAFSEAGITVVLDVIEDGGMARERLKSDYQPAELPHLVLVDMNVPKGDGLRLLEHIRCCGWLHEVPVVVWSSTRVPRDHEAARAFHVADFLVKPADLDGWNQLARQLAALLA